ncbi:glycosyltransferase [Vibrio alginolyticus]|uniref:glycosyltransferase n=1 Tax=Vibrio alginolyticus TaxID=663 RepID=UPI00148BA308|nr:glycosyltransferase [Vibrio alginolyticus]NOH89040.1 glycosyltransferase [Vibrio alginolyticus]
MKFSVLLSVYTQESPSYLKEAMESIWERQTLKPDQIVLVKDGPLCSELEDEIVSWKVKLGDALTLVELPQNIGLGGALNAGLKACRNELVARMDTDDIALPQRFEKQVEFMLRNPSIAASSATLEEWDESFSFRISERKLPVSSAELRKFAIRRSPLSHPVSIFRKSIIESVGGYPDLRKAQDYALWSLLLSKGYQLTNLPDTLLKMRSGKEMLTRRGYFYFKQECRLMRYQKRIGFLSTKNLIVNTSLKAVLRLSPRFTKKIIYRFAR